MNGSKFMKPINRTIVFPLVYTSLPTSTIDVDKRLSVNRLMGCVLNI
jgi:hypothetical protein